MESTGKLKDEIGTGINIETPHLSIQTGHKKKVTKRNKLAIFWCLL